MWKWVRDFLIIDRFYSFFSKCLINDKHRVLNIQGSTQNIINQYDDNQKSASSTKGTITLIHDYVNKR